MKTKLLHLSLVLLLLGSLVYLSGCARSCSPVHERPVNLCDTIKSNVKVNLNAVVFLNQHEGLAAGDQGKIIRTSNAGYNWAPVASGTTEDLYGLGMATPLTVVAVGKKGTILRSTNRGNSWFPVLSENVNFLQSLRTVAFSSPNNGYAAGDSGVIFSTTNGGVNWTKVYGDPLQTYYGLSFNSADVPYLVGNKGKILKTSAWDSITGITTKNLKSIHFAIDSMPTDHENIGFAVGDSGIVLKTTDDGLTWTIVTPLTIKNLRSVFLSSTHWGYAVGENGTVLRYNGKKWVLLPAVTSKSLNAVDPDPWSITSVCVGESGETFMFYPPTVAADNTTEVKPESSDCQLWFFALKNFDNQDEDPSGGPAITYERFEVCSSIQVNLDIQQTMQGWAVRDNFFCRSDIFGTTLPENWGLALNSSTEHPIVTCYYMDTEGNPWMLISYTCTPP